MYPRNAASPDPIAIGAVVAIADGTVQTSGVTVRIKPIGVAEGDGAGTTAYSTDGIVEYTPTQSETNYTSFILIAKKTSCIPVAVTVITSKSDTTGYAGLDWGQMLNKTTTNALTNTTIATTQQVDVNTIKTQTVTCAAGVTVNANVGTTQPINFTGTGASALAKSDMVDIAGAAVSASTAQIGVNVVNFGGSAGTFSSGRPEVNTTHIAGSAVSTSSAQIGVNVVNAGGTAWASGSLTSGVFASGAITAAAIADAAIDRATFAADTGLQSIRSNTAAAGGATSITLDASASGSDNYYNNCLVLITGGTGVGQVRTILDYVGGTQVATVRAWTTNPDNTSTFAILPAVSVWDDVTADHLTSGSTGNALNSAGSAGDPWATALPGAYGSGTAGHILGTAIPDIAPGSSGGLLIGGSNAATTFASLTVTTTTTLTGAVSLGSTLGVTGTTTLAALTTTGTVTFNAFTVSNATTLSGAVSLGSTLGVTGTTTLAALTTTGTVTFNAFTVSNATTLTGAVSLGSTLGVTGTTTLAAVTASSAVTLASLTVSGAFTVSGGTVLTNGAGHGVIMSSTTAGGDGLRILGFGSGDGLHLEGGASGNGLHIADTVVVGDTATLAALTVSGATTFTGAVSATNASNDIRGVKLAATGLAGITAWTVDITGSLSGSVGSVTGAVGSVTGNVGGNVTGSIGSLATQAKADVNAEADTALSDYGALKPTTAGRTLDVTTGGCSGIDWANIESPTTTVALSGTTVKTATDVETDTQDIQSRLPAALVNSRMDCTIDGTGMESAAVAAILTTAMTESYNADGSAPTLAQALFVIMQRLTEFAINSTTITVKKLDGSTTALTLTLDDATSPTSSTRAT